MPQSHTPQMSAHDAALFYDQTIPEGVVDNALPDRFRANIKVTPKPDTVFARMVQVMTTYCMCGSLTISDLERHKFTPAEIKAYGQDAFRAVLVNNRTLLTQEFPA